MSFFKKNSNAKRITELSFNLKTNLIKKEISIKSNKMDISLKLTNDDLLSSDYNNFDNEVLTSYFLEIFLIKKALDYIFTTTEEKYHKYINISFDCSSIYCLNVIKEWIYLWYENEHFKDLNRPCNTIINDIYTKIKKSNKISLV